jgi:hypothetical protein
MLLWKHEMLGPRQGACGDELNLEHCGEMSETFRSAMMDDSLMETSVMETSLMETWSGRFSLGACEDQGKERGFKV